MRAGWVTAKLGDVCNLINRGISPKYLEAGGVCVLNQKCIRDHVINYGLARRHDITTKKVNAERFINVGDVLVNSTGTGTLGRVAQVREAAEEPTTVDSHVTIVRPEPNKFFQDFFGYMLIFIEDEIKAAGEGCGGQTELARSVLANSFTVAYPTSIVEQQRIVAILDEAFEAIAAARANAEQNRQNARALFDTFLNAVYLGGDAGAWPLRRLGDVFDIGSSKRIHERDWSPSGVPFYGGKEIVKLAKFGHAVSNAYISEQMYQDFASKYDMPKAGDILITARGTIGVGYVVKRSDKFYYKDGNIISMRAKEAANPHYLLYAFRSNALADQLGVLSGTTVTHLPLEKAKKLLLRMPEIGIQDAVVKRIMKFEAETQRLESLYQRKIEALDELKQSLLQQAFSGQL